VSGDTTRRGSFLLLVQCGVTCSASIGAPPCNVQIHSSVPYPFSFFFPPLVLAGRARPPFPSVVASVMLLRRSQKWWGRRTILLANHRPPTTTAALTTSTHPPTHHSSVHCVSGPSAGVNKATIFATSKGRKVKKIGRPFPLELGGTLPEVRRPTPLPSPPPQPPASLPYQLEIVYEEWGNAHKPVVVLLPSLSVGSHARYVLCSAPLHAQRLLS